MAVEGDGLVASNSPTGQFKVNKIDVDDLFDLNKSLEPLEVHNASADSFITVDNNEDQEAELDQDSDLGVINTEETKDQRQDSLLLEDPDLEKYIYEGNSDEEIEELTCR